MNAAPPTGDVSGINQSCAGSAPARRSTLPGVHAPDQHRARALPSQEARERPHDGAAYFPGMNTGAFTPILIKRVWLPGAPAMNLSCIHSPFFSALDSVADQVMPFRIDGEHQANVKGPRRSHSMPQC